MDTGANLETEPEDGMRMREYLGVVLVLGVVGPAIMGDIAAAQGRGQEAAAPSPAVTVPKDLRPLLTPRRSEVRLVTLRYTQDRNLLNGNFAGQSGGRGGAGAAATVPVPVSPARIARLKRYDHSWTEAVAQLDAARLSPAGRAGLDSLKALIREAQAAIGRDEVTFASYAPLVPFRQSLVDLIETRLRLEPVRSQEAAATLDQAIRSVTRMRAAFDSGFSAAPSEARAAAGAVDALRANLNTWFGFYNNFDPLFTWWMGVPHRDLTAALTGYSAWLRDTVAVAGQPNSFTVTPAAIAMAPAPRYAEVPDLADIVALPQDELMDIMTLFRTGGLGGTGRGGGGGQGGGQGGAGSLARNEAYNRDWLTALRSLDFDKLTRNAQVNYLYIRKTAELRLSRVGQTLAANPPRKQDDSGIPGAARGRQGLIWDLQDEFINYTPEQLMVLADREFAWAEAEMLKASREMGFGDDWKAAQEKVKQGYVPPGEQPQMIRGLIFQAIDYLREHDLITVPQIAAESQRMSMLSAAAQLQSPFFLGGSQIQVAYPTNEMSYDARMQSMRGNNPFFSHATVHHELIPGHNLTGYLNARYTGHRAGYASTPFHTEGWALYWELVLYDKGFNVSPEDRIGALFWRMHRCARIIFSLKFHMGLWSPQEAVDFLVDKVGHERDNARAEVLRSFQGNYPPLYQAGYLLGGIQLRGLRKELVDTGLMTEREFHDAILLQGTMPINLIRLAVGKQKLTRDMNIDWDFYGPLPAEE